MTSIPLVFTYSDHVGRRYLSIAWNQVERILGHPYSGQADNAALIDYLSAGFCEPEWALNADFYADRYGWTLVGPAEDEP